MSLRSVTFLLLLLYFFTSWSQKTELRVDKANDRDISGNKNASTESIKVSPSIVRRYEDLLDSASVFEKKVITQILQTINTHGNKPFSYEYFTIGEIDGIGKQDTLTTKISVLNDTVYLESKWLRDGELLWENKLKDPYLWISDDGLFSYETCDIWARLTFAKDYSIPDLSPKSRFSNIPIDLVMRIGLSEIEGSDVNEEEYLKYINEFDGMLMEYGEPEVRNLVIWFEPLKEFVTYYAP